jgi:DNA-binding NarL/FixJ family response regulator
MAPPRLVLVATHLMFQSRIREGARALGFKVTTVDTMEAARDALHSAPTALLVLDLQAEGVSWEEVVAAAKERPGGPVPILAYGQHTKPALLRSARAAGCDLVVPRSRLVEDLPRLIERVVQGTPARS